jgi:predicted metal-dependent hydrolase
MSEAPLIEQLDRDFERIADLERKLAHMANRLGAGAQRAFWKSARGLELRAASYDRSRDELVVAFHAGPEYRMAASALKLPAAVRDARLDELKHGAMVRLADGSETSVASDLVLYECEPAYRETLEPRDAVGQRDFGARIRALRLAAGLRAKDVAVAAGLAASNYARLEASKHQPRIETLVRVAKALGVPLASLVSEEGR